MLTTLFKPYIYHSDFCLATDAYLRHNRSHGWRFIGRHRSCKSENKHLTEAVNTTIWHLSRQNWLSLYVKYHMNISHFFYFLASTLYILHREMIWWRLLHELISSFTGNCDLFNDDNMTWWWPWRRRVHVIHVRSVEKRQGRLGWISFWLELNNMRALQNKLTLANASPCKWARATSLPSSASSRLKTLTSFE